MKSEQDIILENLNPTISKTFCCQGCNGKVREEKDRRIKTVDNRGRITKVTRCKWCIDAIRKGA